MIATIFFLYSMIVVCFPRNITQKADYRWTFDCSDAREDLTGLYNGTLINGVSFVQPDYAGQQGKALQLDRQRYQYVTLPRSLNLTLNRSFTLSAWIFIAGYRTKTILSDCNSFNPICIIFLITDYSLNLRLMQWKNGSILDEKVALMRNSVCQACWMYTTFSFDHQTGSTIIYLNGVAVLQSRLNMIYPTLPSVNETKVSHIGLNAVTGLEPFYGLIDRLSITYFVKNVSDILYEATTLCYYTFNTDDIDVGTGPNSIRARSQHVYRFIAMNRSSILFNTTDSYFQTSGFTLLDSNDYNYSFAFWLRLIIPNSTMQNSAIAVLQLTSLITGLSSGSYTCVISMHVYPNNGTIGYFFPRMYEVVNVNNSLVKNDTWVHLGVAFASPDTYLFYQNGELIHTYENWRLSSIISDYPRLALTVGGAYLDDSIPEKPDNFEKMKCFARIPIFNYTNMYGGIDYLGFYARNLNTSEFANLVAMQTYT